MADWFIATEGVKVVKDSASLWPQIITAVSSIGAALGGVSLTHHFTRRREERATAAQQASERLFIATELVFLLEYYAIKWLEVDTEKRLLHYKAEKMDLPLYIQTRFLSYGCDNFLRIYSRGERYPSALCG